MKAVPLALLLFAAAIFVLSWFMQQRSDAAVWGFVRAAAEAGIVGGLADWFAVTALFRRPLGLPIPHTNLIATKKDQIGESLGDFVQTNFLTEATIRDKVASAEPALRIGQYLQDPGHREFLVAGLAQAGEAGIESLNDDDVSALVSRMLVDQAAAFDWAQPTGALLQAIVEDHNHVPAVDAFLKLVSDWVRENQNLIVSIVADRGPAQGVRLARSVHEAVGRRAALELLRWLDEAYTDPNSKTRGAIDSWLKLMAEELQSDPEMIAKGEQLKLKFLASGELHKIVTTVWPTTKRLLLDALHNPDSELRRRGDELIGDVGDRLVADQQLRDRVDGRIERSAVYLVERYAAEFTTIISDTVRRWDPTEASRRIELQVGRDLQFIRINGTVVGALAGLALHTLAVVALG